VLAQHLRIALYKEICNYFGMDAFEALGDPVRRRITQLISAGALTSGDLAARIGTEFGISQPAVSRHLGILRQVGLVQSQTSGQRRIYTVRTEAIDDIADWFTGIQAFWTNRMDALGVEIARGMKAHHAAAIDRTEEAS
jgi:DNA-binding transcriptional ArsR family regulator